jgi:7-cyano-7-deazaguanine synthase
MSSTILIYSGGLDSTVLLYRLLFLKEDVRALSINYGQRHLKEIAAARMIAVRAGVTHKVADLSSVRQFLRGSSQTDPSVEVPHGHYTDESMKQTVVPNRNMLMLSVALAWAISEKADSITYAGHSGDRAIYPDCREEFASAFNTAALLADWHQVRLERPFIDMTKAEIVTMGNELDVPFGLTWSCYEGRAQHCGRCGTCVERQEAFREANVKDPTEYDLICC